MINLFKKLNEPFPESPSYEGHVRTLVGISIFITLFLYIFQPFEIDTYPYNPFWICAAFGIITFITAIVYDFFTEKVLKLQKDIPSWTLWKWMVDMVCMVSLIAVGNYLYMVYSEWQAFSWSHFIQMLVSTFSLGIFPIVFSGMMIQMRANERHRVQAELLQSNLEKPKPLVEPSNAQVTLTSQKNTQSITLPTTDLLYLEAMQNYVAVCYLKEEKIEKTIFRNTIKQMEEQLETTPLIRCHRSFIVNPDLIENVAGNAQGLRLSLNNLADFEVPVSRKYIPTLRAITS